MDTLSHEQHIDIGFDIDQLSLQMHNVFFLPYSLDYTHKTSLHFFDKFLPIDINILMDEKQLDVSNLLKQDVVNH